MGKTAWDMNKEMMALYETENNTFDDFPIGTEIKIITGCQDFHFFYGETGKVIRNSGDYLGITVEFYKPRHFEGGYIQKDFNFGPKDLAIWNTKTKVIDIEQKRISKLCKEALAKEIEQKKRSARFEIMDL